MIFKKKIKVSQIYCPTTALVCYHMPIIFPTYFQDLSFAPSATKVKLDINSVGGSSMTKS
jgi:hypothetical protein